eukprot:CAMPEP_0204641176 /NCGR_PEP_ID=MMETSP0717-20131115/50281_1 /ASSEMBLY_ACC=CAM_ASM_000666 /TAXON_ID=230516 /ORGANISM="Chaetoceros curvisetus" /LENGTH=378 /DNA_ID=CAMNT_0051661787 /DNA_START=97 /DNA_END=1233 /DNA_ORIENTATION=-
MCKKNYDSVSKPFSTEYQARLNEAMKTSDGKRAQKPTTTLLQVFLWSLLTFVSKEFSLFLPNFQSDAGAKTFIHAAYQYDEDLSVFDNTIWTWGTDYAIAVIFTFAAIQCWKATEGPTQEGYFRATGADASSSLPQSSNSEESKRFRTRSALLLLSYAISVLFGGYAHYTFRSTEELNSVPFRIYWIICVGSVTAAGGFMGSFGSEICLKMNRMVSEDQVRFRMPYVSDLLWFIYGGYLTYVCMVGGMSYQRPACDIFAAGGSQFVPTAYCVLTMLSIKWTDAKKVLEAPIDEHSASAAVRAVKRNYRYMFYIGFFLNAPLLPVYPALVQYTNLSTGVINAILHLNLTVAWGMQFLSLHHLCKVFNLTITGAGLRKDL